MMMNSYEYYFFILTLFILIGCNQSKRNEVKNLKSTDSEETDYDKEVALQLFKQKCYACHSTISASHDEIIAPPMVTAKRRYKMSFRSKKEFVDALSLYAFDPKPENALMFGAVRRFKVMPKSNFDMKDLQLIASYIYDHDIEKPKWFESHFDEMHSNISYYC